MRATITIETECASIREAIENLTNKWRAMNDDLDAVLPQDAEIFVAPSDDEDATSGIYKVTYIARAKI